MFRNTDTHRVAKLADFLISAVPEVQPQVWRKVAKAADANFSGGYISPQGNLKTWTKAEAKANLAVYEALLDLVADWEGYPAGSTRFAVNEAIVSALSPITTVTVVAR